MGRRLLSFPILRTRSARKKLVGGSVIVLLGALTIGGCEEAPPSRPELAKPPAEGPISRPAVGATGPTGQLAAPRDEVTLRVAQELEALAVDAGIERGQDPLAPGGDIARDIAAFTTLDACVGAHRMTDPVLADAIDTLGYDTLARDACRVVQALKAKDARFCQPISPSPLRLRCQAQVAVLAGEPALCPLVAGSGAMPAREPVCLARASRDERLCSAALPADRTVCKALVRGLSGECGGDGACVRQVERFRSLLEKPQSHAPFPARLHIEFASDREKAERFEGAFDLEDVAAAGAVARPIGDKVRLMIGKPKSSLWASWDSPHATPSIYLALTVPTQAATSAGKGTDAAPGWVLGPSEMSLDLLIPQIALLSGTLARDRHLVTESVSAAAGGRIRLTLTTTLIDASRAFRVKIDLETFVRDGVGPRSAAKMVP